MSPRPRNVQLLAETPVGTKVRIAGIDGGTRVQARLVGMGLIAGRFLDVRVNGQGGPVLVAAGHARIALGRGMAEKVRVEPVNVARADKIGDLRSA